MIWILTAIGLLFIAIGFILTVNNAKYLLSGYNTMNEEQRASFNIQAYVPYFKKFHFFLGTSLIAIGLLLNYLVNESVAGIFLAIYPIAAYVYFIWIGSKYAKGISQKRNKIALYIIIGTLVFIVSLLVLGFRESKISFSPNSIEIGGIYGEEINLSEVKSIELVDNIPPITIKTNGFALGSINKGYFKTKEGEVVKLILNSLHAPYILLTKLNGDKLYFSSSEKPNADICNELKKKAPNILYK